MEGNSDVPDMAAAGSARELNKESSGCSEVGCVACGCGRRAQRVTVKSLRQGAVGRGRTQVSKHCAEVQAERRGPYH